MERDQNFRLASYNIRKCVGLDRRRRPGRIVDVLNSLGADIIALQEADRRLGDRPAALPARLVEEETDFICIDTGINNNSVGWHGNALLVHKDLVAKNITRLDLPGTEPRGALAAEVSPGLRIFATHLGLMRSDRRRQLQDIRTAADDSIQNTVILGDFNEWSKSRGMEALEQDFNIHSPGRSFHAARPVAALDRVALGRGLKMVDAGVCETALARIASDHLPVWVDIQPRDRGAA